MHRAVTILASLMLAQPPTRPGDDPELQNPSVEGHLTDQARKTLDETGIRPAGEEPGLVVPPTVPAPEGVDLTVPGRRVYPEGSFLTPRVGRLVLAGDDAIFVPAGEDNTTDPPMVLLPCEGLARILAGPSKGDLTIGGQVFVYRGRHYLLPTTWSFGALAPAQPPPTAQPEADPSVRDLIRAMEEGVAPRAVVPVQHNETLPAGPSGTGARITDGTVLVNRRARVVRLASAGGRYAATFDNDPSSPAPAPMILLPGRMLERIESVASWRGENTVYLISGRVYEHQGRSYLLPVLARVAPPGDVSSMQ
jgi:hypothetical protein